MSYCEGILSHAKNLRVDECEAVFSDKKITTIRITDSEIVEIKQNYEKTLGIRLINGKKISSAQTSAIEDSSIVEQALQLSHLSKPKQFWKNLPFEFKKQNSIERTCDQKLRDISGSDASDMAQTMINACIDQKVTSISGSLNIVSEKFEIQNTNGLRCSDDATYISGMINADSNIGSDPVSGIGQMSGRTLSGFSPETVGNDAKKMCVESINPQKCDDDVYSVIFEPYSVGEMLAFVFAMNFNFKTFSEKRSCFTGKMNEKISVEKFSLMDDPYAPEGVGSKTFDDEGVSTNQNYFIKNGVLCGTYSNLFDAHKENTESTGNANRMGSPMGRSSDPIPFSAPHNLKVLGEKISKDEMIKDTKHGLLVGRLWYTYAVNPIKGDFSCTARSGVRIIEEGEIKSPGKSVRIVHNLPAMLQNISGIGDDSKNVLQWASLPSITPSIKSEKIRAVPI